MKNGVQLSLQLFKDSLDNWYNAERLNSLKSFIDYIKTIVKTFGFSDDEIKSVVQEQLSE